MFVTHLQLRKEKQKKNIYDAPFLFARKFLENALSLSSFQKHWIVLILFVVLWKRKKKYEFLSVAFIWCGLKLQGKCISSSKDISK